MNRKCHDKVQVSRMRANNTMLPIRIPIDVRLDAQTAHATAITGPKGAEDVFFAHESAR